MQTFIEGVGLADAFKIWLFRIDLSSQKIKVSLLLMHNYIYACVIHAETHKDTAIAPIILHPLFISSVGKVVKKLSRNVGTQY